MNKKIAICTPTYNGLDFTKEFIASCKSKYPIKHFIFDNGSTDGTAEWLFENLKDASIIRSKENLGITIGCNRANMEAYNDKEITHIIYANSDIIYRPETIDALVWAWDNRQDERIARISGAEVRADSYTELHERYRAWDHVLSVDITKPSMIYGASYTTFIWDKKAIDLAGLLDEATDYYDDNIHAEIIIRKGLTQATFIPAIFFHYGSMGIKSNPQDQIKFQQKFQRDQEYAFKFFGVDTQIGIRDCLERGREEWSPRLLEISKKMQTLRKDYLNYPKGV